MNKNLPLLQVKRLTYNINLDHERLSRLVVGWRRLHGIVHAFKTVRKISDQGMPLFEPLSFELFPGHILALCGPSNSGKTTVGRILSGALLPSSGEAIIRGSFAPAIGGMVLFMEEVTVVPNIFYIAAMCGFTKKVIAPLINKIIDWAELGKYKNTKIFDLDIELKFRLLLSVILHLPADIILIDGLLDSSENFNKEKVLSLLGDIRNRGGSVVILTRRFDSVKPFVDSEVKLVPNQAVYEAQKKKAELEDLVGDQDIDEDV